MNPFAQLQYLADALRQTRRSGSTTALLNNFKDQEFLLVVNNARYMDILTDEHKLKDNQPFISIRGANAHSLRGTNHLPLAIDNSALIELVELCEEVAKNGDKAMQDFMALRKIHEELVSEMNDHWGFMLGQYPLDKYTRFPRDHRLNIRVDKVRRLRDIRYAVEKTVNNSKALRVENERLEAQTMVIPQLIKTIFFLALLSGMLLFAILVLMIK